MDRTLASTAEDKDMIQQWIPFSEGEYLADRAFLVSRQEEAVALEHTIIKVYLDPDGQRQMHGRGRVVNLLVVDLLQDNDQIDLALDLGQEFKYILPNPHLTAGKVFSPDVKSVLQFVPIQPWKPVPPEAFEAFRSRLHFLNA